MPGTSIRLFQGQSEVLTVQTAGACPKGEVNGLAVISRVKVTGLDRHSLLSLGAPCLTDDGCLQQGHCMEKAFKNLCIVNAVNEKISPA